MDVNDIRSLVTMISFAVFIGIVVWAWGSAQKKRFSEAANLPFLDEDLPPTNSQDSNATLGYGGRK